MADMTDVEYEYETQESEKVEPPRASEHRPGLFRSDQDRLAERLAEYHSELMKKLLSQETLLKQMMPMIEAQLKPKHLPPAPELHKDEEESTRRVSLQVGKANSEPSRTSGISIEAPRLFSTFTRTDLKLQDMAASVDGRNSRARFASMRFAAASTKRTGDAIHSMVTHPAFDAFFALVVISNSIFIGFEVEGSIQVPPTRSEFMQALAYLFTALFTAELFLRMAAFGRDLFCSDDWSWALLDVFIVCSSWWEIVVDISHAVSDDSSIESIAGISSLKAFRIIRITRILKTVQLMRVLRFVVALRTLVTSIFHTLKSLIWALILLGLIVYVFAVLFTQAVNDFANDPVLFARMPLEAQEATKTYYRTLPITMLSLFMSIAGGVSWEQVLEPLFYVSEVWIAIYLFYISFTYFAVLNVVTGTFCQTAMDSAQNDHATMMHAILANKQSHLEKVKDLFNRLGAEQNGSITYLMFEEKINSPEVREYFQSLGLDVWDAWSFFKMLDLDESGAVDMEEFLMGCLRVRGTAKAIDISKIIHDQTWQIKNQGKFQTYVELELKQIKDMLAKES